MEEHGRRWSTLTKALLASAWAWALIATLGACRSSGDFRLRYEPQPVPRDARSGTAWFVATIDSLARQPVRIGKHGPWLAAGASLNLEAQVARGEHELRYELYDAAGRLRATLQQQIQTTQALLGEESCIPLPRIAGGQARVIAGFHAANHRLEGRRRALDLIAPEGLASFDAPVTSPFSGRVLGVTAQAPDIPGGQPNELVLRADDGRIFLYSHFRRDSIPWKPGERIAAGELLGRIGLSGATSGPHLHIELLTPER